MDEAKLARAMRRRGKETSEAERIENQRILDEYKNMGFPDTDIGKTDINWKPYSEEDADEPYQKGGFAEIKIDNGFIFDPKNDRMIENHGRYCDGRLYCETGYRGSGCDKCVKIPDDAPPSITTRQMRRDSDEIDDEINSMLTDAVSRRGGRRRRKTRRQRKSRRQRKTRRQRKSRRTR